MAYMNTDELIIDAVKKHYENHDSPYYLAEIGQWFRSQKIEIPEGIRFKDYLISRFHGRLVVVQDEDNPAKIAIAPPEIQLRVKQQLSGVVTVEPDDSKIDHSRLPFALIAAFCKVPVPGTQIYFRVTMPFRYETRMQAPDDTYIEIDDQFRPSSLAGKSVHDLSYDDRQTIYEYIEKWAAAKSFNLQHFYYDRGSKSARSARHPVRSDENALQRLINAQEPELRERIRIPGDIASTLMRLP